MKFEELSNYRLAALDARHEQIVLEKSLVIHTSLSIFFVIEGLLVVVDSLLDQYSELIPENVG